MDDALNEFFKRLRAMNQEAAQGQGEAPKQPPPGAWCLKAGDTIRIGGPVWEPERVAHVKVARLGHRVNIW